MSAKTFRKTANDICRQARELREDVMNQPVTAETATSVVESYRSIVQQQIDSLRALQPPSKLAPKVKRMLSTAKKALAHVVADPEALIGGPDPFAAVETQASALGLKECAT